jgi:RNA polymerase sigma-70 factor (ECF subfamily)
MVEDFDAWYAEARASLAPALAAWCSDTGIASDAIDEAFVRAVERWDHVRSLASPHGWVWQTAMNVVRRRARRSRMEERLLRRRAVGHDRLVAGPTGSDIDLHRALLSLGDRQRTAVVLFYIADLPVAEVAEIMGIATGTVDATLHRARHLLRERLEAEHDDVDDTDNPCVSPAHMTDGALP